jgi:hypothetical protein
LAKFGREPAVPPGAVRNQKVEKSPFLSRLLLLEEASRISGEFEKADALGHVGLVGALVLFD